MDNYKNEVNCLLKLQIVFGKELSHCSIGSNQKLDKRYTIGINPQFHLLHKTQMGMILYKWL